MKNSTTARSQTSGARKQQEVRDKLEDVNVSTVLFLLKDFEKKFYWDLAEALKMEVRSPKERIRQEKDHPSELTPELARRFAAILAVARGDLPQIPSRRRPKNAAQNGGRDAGPELELDLGQNPPSEQGCLSPSEAVREVPGSFEVNS